MIKILICVCICAGTTYIGIGFAKYYSKRKLFFNDLKRFCQHLRAGILFSQTKLENLIKSYESESEDFNQLLNQFFTKNVINRKRQKILYMKKNESFQINIFFESIGKHDVENECNLIDAFQSQIEFWLKDIEIENLKYATMSPKLGLCLGLVISIIIF